MRGHRSDGNWVDGWDRLKVAALHEGDQISPRETVMTIEGDYSLFAHLETVYLGSLARRSLIMHNVSEVVEAARGKEIFYFPARHDHWLVQTGDGWSAHVAGAIGVSTDAQASWWGGRGIGTVPHGLIAAYGGDTVVAARKFADHYHEQMNVTVSSTSSTTRSRRRWRWLRRSDRSCGACGWTRPRQLVDRSLFDEMGGFTPTGVNPRWSRRSAARWTAPVPRRQDRRHRRIHREADQRVRGAGVPVDAYGVGSSLIRGNNDFTADVVLLDGKPMRQGRAVVFAQPPPSPCDLTGTSGASTHGV